MKKLVAMMIACALVSCKQGDDSSSHQPVAAPEQGTPADTTPETDPQAEKTRREQQENLCLQDLCGPATNYLASRGEGPFATLLSEDVKVFFKNEVDDRLAKTVQLSLKNLRTREQLLTHTLERLEHLDLNDEQFAWLVYQSISAKLIPYMEKATEKRGGRSYLVFERLPQEAINAQPSFYYAAVNFINTLSASRAQHLVAGIGESLMKYKFIVTKNDKETQPAWVRYLNQLERDRKSLEKRFGLHTFTDLTPEILNKEIQGKELTQREMNLLLKLITRVTLLKAFDEPTVQNAAKNLNLDVYAWADALQWRQEKHKVESFLEDAETSKNLLQQMQTSCKEAIVQTLAAAPSEFRLKRAQLLLDGVKVAAKSATQEYLQGPALTKARAAIDKVRFETPKTYDQARLAVIADLEGLMASQKNISSALTDAEAEKGRSIITNQILLLLVDPKITFSLMVKNTCDSLRPPLFEDHAREEGEDLIIRLGWQSASFHQIGAGIMAHEIGHIVSSTANILESSDQDYWKTRQCSTDIHQKLLENHQGEHKAQQYQEEDWADAFAVTTLKILNKTWPYVQNYACALTGIQDGKYVNNGLINASATDTHSTGLYRAVQVHTGLGKTLPESCTAYLGDQARVTSKTCSK